MNLDDVPTREVALRAVGSVSAAVAGFLLSEHPEIVSEPVGGLGGLLFLGGIIYSARWVTAGVDRLFLWWHTRKFEVNNGR